MLKKRLELRTFGFICLLTFFAQQAFAQTTATLGEKLVGTTGCTNSANMADFDTLAQCNSTTNATGTFQKAPLFAGKVASPPYASTACDASKAGMIQWTGTSFQGCNGSSWQNMSGGTSSGSVLQSLYTSTKAFTGFWSNIPYNTTTYLPNTTVQTINLGSEVLNQSITTTSTDSTIEVEAEVFIGADDAGTVPTEMLSLFQYPQTNAIASSFIYNTANSITYCQSVHLYTQFTSKSVQTIDFRLRAGIIPSAGWHLNGCLKNNFTSIVNSWMRVREIQN